MGVKEQEKLEEVIKGLAACMPETEDNATIGCENCPYNCGENYQDNDHVTLPVALIEDIRALLKAQEQEASDVPKPDSDVGCWYDITHNYTLEQVVSALKAQEPRVMSLEEVLNTESRAEPLWCEFIDCALGSWRMGWKLKTEGKREVQHILENPIERAVVWESEYKKGWRCWTSRPTDAQREATPWLDH